MVDEVDFPGWCNTLLPAGGQWSKHWCRRWRRRWWRV